MDSGCTLLRLVVDEAALRYPVQALHDRRLDQTHRSVYVVILDSRDQNLLALLEQVLLNSSDVRNVAYVLVEPRIDGHVLGADRESFAMFVLVLNVEDERNARRILAHHLLQEAHCQVDALHNQRLVSLVEMIDDFCEFFGHQ